MTWEYSAQVTTDTIDFQQFEDRLCTMGRDGWELVAITDMSSRVAGAAETRTAVKVLIFKRPAEART
jgi:hypothetical protein